MFTFIIRLSKSVSLIKDMVIVLSSIEYTSQWEITREQSCTTFHKYHITLLPLFLHFYSSS